MAAPTHEAGDLQEAGNGAPWEGLILEVSLNGDAP
jgi:hypothetical protein